MAVEQSTAAPRERTHVADLARHYDRLNLGCGEDTRDGWLNVDQVGAVEPDLQLDITATPWPFPSDSFETVLASHVLEHLDDPVPVLEECARVLQPGGRLDVRVPIGADAVTDPDHETVWHWDTPARFCGAETWDSDVGLRVVHREVDMWTHLPGRLGAVHEHVLRGLQSRVGDGRWAFGLPATSGEFAVTFTPR